MVILCFILSVAADSFVYLRVGSAHPTSLTCITIRVNSRALAVAFVFVSLVVKEINWVLDASVQQGLTRVLYAMA
jgi:hypothetical protein